MQKLEEDFDNMVSRVIRLPIDTINKLKVLRNKNDCSFNMMINKLVETEYNKLK